MDIMWQDLSANTRTAGSAETGSLATVTSASLVISCSSLDLVKSIFHNDFLTPLSKNVGSMSTAMLHKAIRCTFSKCSHCKAISLYSLD